MMNYFEFYNIPVSFFPDEEEVKRQFYLNSKKYHPDFFVNEPKDKQDEILQLSTINNEAYKTLSSLEKRVEYILELNGLISEGEKYTLPQDFLMEMMEINEEIMELGPKPDEEKLAVIKSKVAVTEKEINEELMKVLKEFDSLKTEANSSILLKIKDIYYRKKYLLRIKDSLDKFASPN
jgi:molecular chaperone HscB